MPLMRERDLESALDALDGFPIERRLECAALHAPAAGGNEPFGDVALAPAVVRGIDGQAERGVAMRDGALHMIVDPGFVASHIELIEAVAPAVPPPRDSSRPGSQTELSMCAAPNSATARTTDSAPSA